MFGFIFQGDSLFLGTDRLVTKLDVHFCDEYKICTKCAADPYCGWSTKHYKCTAYSPGDTTYV